jgi:hypothetical protein
MLEFLNQQIEMCELAIKAHKDGIEPSKDWWEGRRDGYIIVRGQLGEKQ